MTTVQFIKGYNNGINKKVTGSPRELVDLYTNTHINPAAFSLWDVREDLGGSQSRASKEENTQRGACPKLATGGKGRTSFSHAAGILCERSKTCDLLCHTSFLGSGSPN